MENCNEHDGGLRKTSTSTKIIFSIPILIAYIYYSGMISLINTDIDVPSWIIYITLAYAIVFILPMISIMRHWDKRYISSAKAFGVGVGVAILDIFTLRIIWRVVYSILDMFEVSYHSQLCQEICAAIVITISFVIVRMVIAGMLSRSKEREFNKEVNNKKEESQADSVSEDIQKDFEHIPEEKENVSMKDLIDKVRYYGKMLKKISPADYIYYKDHIGDVEKTDGVSKMIACMPVGLVFVILLKLYLYWGEALRVINDVKLVSAMVGIGIVCVLTIVLILRHCNKKFVSVGKSVLIGIGVVVLSVISSFITYVVVGLSAMLIDEDYGLKLEIISIILMLLNCMIILGVIWLSTSSGDENAKINAMLSSEDAKFYDWAVNNLHGIDYKVSEFGYDYERPVHIDGTADKYVKPYLAVGTNVEKIDKYELDSKIQIPYLVPLNDYDGRANYLSFINSARKNMESEVIVDYLQCNDDKIKIRNTEKEEYVLEIKALLKMLPDFPFDILKANNIKNPLRFGTPEFSYWGEDYSYCRYGTAPYFTKTPNFTSAATKLVEQTPFQRLVQMYSEYNRNLKEFFNDAKGTIIGEEGERAVMKELDFYAKQWRILSNIRLEVNGESLESDIIAVTPHGVFAVEVKNLGSTGSYNIQIEKDGLWKKVMKNGRWKQMGSVSKQNTRHLHGIEQVVNTKLNNTYDNWISANSIIVFANDVVNITNRSENVIVRASEMVGEIRKHPICLNEAQINQIANILQESSLEPKRYEMRNWGKEILQAHLEIYARAKALLPQVKPMLDLAAALADISIYPLSPTDFAVTNEPEFTLEDDESDYQKSDKEIAQEKEAERNRKLQKERDEQEEREREARLRQQEEEEAEAYARAEAERRAEEEKNNEDFYYYYKDK